MNSEVDPFEIERAFQRWKVELSAHGSTEVVPDRLSFYAGFLAACKVQRESPCPSS